MYHNKFIPWWKSLPENIQKDIVEDFKNKTLSVSGLCTKYKLYKFKSSYIYYINKMLGLTTTAERDKAIANMYESGIPPYVIKKEYNIDNIEFNAIIDVVNVIGFNSKKLF